jgi:cytochrome c oxidase subunit 4
LQAPDDAPNEPFATFAPSRFNAFGFGLLRSGIGECPMSNKEHIIVRAKTFVLVWAALLLLTAVTVAAAELRIGAASIVVPLLIASAKASLVLWFFMHLKYERMLFRLMLLVPIVTLTFILVFTFFDIWYR